MSGEITWATPLELDEGPPPRSRCWRCKATTAACSCYDEWFALAEQLAGRKVLEEADRG